jgi:rhodanese-related sulfurtransferase
MLDDAKEVCPTTTLRMAREGALLVDVRERDEIAAVAFDVPDLVVMPLSEFEQRYAELPLDRDLVMVCRVGERSLRATYYLMHRGYTRVANMKGGIARWIGKGFPVNGDGAAAIATVASGCGCSSATAEPAPAVASAQASRQGCCASPAKATGSCC